MGELYFGGKIYTMLEEGDLVEAVYVENGKIVGAGSYYELEKRYSQEIEESINLNGKTMYPGFVDSHLHIVGHGERLMRLDLSYYQSIEEVKNAIRTHAKSLDEGEWLIGDGWDENQWEMPHIFSRDELDELCSNNPMVLTRVCRHALLANSKAIEKAGVSNESKDPQGGVIVRDFKGVPNGFFLDNAQDIIKSVMPEVTDEYLRTAIRLAIDDLHRNGIVGGHSEDLHYYGGFKKTLQGFVSIIEGEKRTFKAHLLVHHGAIDEMVTEGYGIGDGTSYVELGAMKIFADGAIGGRTAWLAQQYEDDPGNYGVSIHSEESFEKLIQRARQLSMPIAVHTIGDQALSFVLDHIEKYPPVPGTRDRIIHAQIVNEELYERMAKLELIVDVQPYFVASDFPWVIQRIGKEREAHAYPWKTLINHNIVCAGGSDAPIEDINPLLGIQAAVLRRSKHDGKEYGESQKLSVFEAISLYTKGSAFAINKEHIRGIISPGYDADFTVLNQDLFQLPPELYTQAIVEMTIVDGSIMYDRTHQPSIKK
ncbi:amidohydrolase [Bacillaceae bacterium S4-13-58]